ncbi:MutS family DNA mismatch repair protein [Dictyobacter aurantiacus]|uniref:DNA mismatch repair protein n=1 Tax=Dictyobacter aurantiacus TaxID=1936993 RepID=A0A401Z7K0_9CHLR|nr:MutS family DNA mismatch repair protein [Dictyobacter aurantiacus]GCE02824.1 DNA mismatch repair protein [Dictyobacter aurantiacus]
MESQFSKQELLERQIGHVQRRLAQTRQLDQNNKVRTLGVIGGGIFLTIVGLATVHWLGFLFLLATCLGFYLLARFQPNVNQSVLRYQVWLRILETQQARLRLDWDGMPSVPPREEQEIDHPFEIDLDISGERSVHRLLNTAVSLEGTLRLRDWLLELEPDPDIIHDRQALVRELTPLTRFRDKLLLYSSFATRFTSGPVDGDRLLDWLEAQAESKQTLTSLLVACGLAVLFYLSVLLFVFEHTSPLFCAVTLIASFVWYLMTRKEQGNLAEDTHAQRVAFGQLQFIFNYLEKYPYARQSQLRTLCAPFFEHGDRRPSLLLKQLERITSLATLARSPEAWAIANAILPIGALTAYRLDQCKALIAQYLPIWLDVWYELEATCSLANFAYLNPEYVFPEIVVDKKNSRATVFQARELGHPMIAKEHKVANDFQLEEDGEILLITGSNMAGKSTFLRTLGVNMCLAYAGSVVNASSLRLSLFEIYACIRVTDSLADGYSYFYAEVRRLKGLLDAIDEDLRYPIFFLIDEIFKGTNNYERLIGSEAYIRALVEKKCTGAISTHDLELVKLADLFPIIKNAHFRENIIEGHMVFEYLLREGPSPTRNALRIMQMEGLPINWDAISSAQS